MTAPPPVPLQRHYHQVSAFKFVLLSLFTLNLYKFFWFYKSWKYVQRRDDSGAGILALLYLLWQVSGALPDPYWPFIFLMFVPLIPAVVSVAALNRGVPKPKGNLAVTLLVGVVGIFATLTMTLTLLMSLRIIPAPWVVDGDWLREQDIQFLSDYELLHEGESVLLFFSGGTWSIREDGQFLTERRLVSYTNSTEGSEIYHDEVSYEEIVGVRVQWSQSWADYSIVTITAEGDYEFQVWLSPDEGGDRKFVKELKKRANLGGKRDD